MASTWEIEVQKGVYMSTRFIPIIDKSTEDHDQMKQRR
jgi:hypothetical protein